MPSRMACLKFGGMVIADRLKTLYPLEWAVEQSGGGVSLLRMWTLMIGGGFGCGWVLVGR